VRREIEAWFQAESHRSVIDVLELRKRCKLEKELLTVLLEAEEVGGRIELASGGKIRLAGRRAELSPGEEKLAGEVRRRYTEARFQPPVPEDLVAELRQTPAEIQKAIEHLVDAGELDRIGGEVYLGESAIAEARAAISENCTKNGHLQIPELRDRLQTSRKYLIPILEYFDAKGLTLRQAGRRVLRTR
jgi:selenocysteine-specific elongation factor